MKRYGAEFSVDMIGYHHKLTFPHELDNQELIDMEDEFPSHIYMVTSRPKILIYPDDNVVKEKVIEYTFGVNSAGEIKKYKIQIPFVEEFPKNTIKSNYPHNDFKCYINGEYAYAGNAGLFLSLLLNDRSTMASMKNELIEHLNLEVMYIGKAYGTKGSRNTRDRLKSHSTLQEIVSEMHYSYPDKEVMLVLWSFEPGFTSSFDGLSGKVNVSDEETDRHIINFFSNFISEEQRISFTEAALIKYFQPEFNTIYKQNFPRSTHTTYSECYDLDVNNVLVCIGTDKLNLKLYSEEVKPSYNHDIRYFLHSKQDRLDMFDYITG